MQLAHFSINILQLANVCKCPCVNCFTPVNMALAPLCVEKDSFVGCVGVQL